MEGIKRISGLITAFDIREIIKYYTTSFVEKKICCQSGNENWQFWILYCYTSFDVIKFNDIKVHTNLEFNSVRSMKKTYCLQNNITEVIDFVVPI